MLIVGCVGVTEILQMGIAHRATSDRFFAFLSKTAFPLFIKFKKIFNILPKYISTIRLTCSQSSASSHLDSSFRDRSDPEGFLQQRNKLRRLARLVLSLQPVRTWAAQKLRFPNLR